MLIENDKNTNQNKQIFGDLSRGFYYSPEILSELKKRWAQASDLYNLQTTSQEISDFTNLVNALKASPNTVYLLPIWSNFVYNAQGFIRNQDEGSVTAPSRLQWSKVVAYAFFWKMIKGTAEENYLYNIAGVDYNLGQVCKLIVLLQFSYPQFNFQNLQYYNVNRTRDLSPYFWVMEVCQMVQLIIELTREVWTTAELCEVYNIIMKNNESYAKRFTYACDQSIYGRSQFIEDYEPQNFDGNFALATTEQFMWNGSTAVLDYPKTINNRYTRGMGSCLKEELLFGGIYYINLIKATFKDYIAYNVYLDNADITAQKGWTELHRSTKALVDSGEPAVDGINYVFVTELDLAEWAFLLWFHRGDKELLNYQTAYGQQKTNTVTPKTFLNQLQFEGEYLDGTLVRYVSGATTGANYLINGLDAPTGKIRVNDIFPMAIANMFYNDGELYGIYTRQRKGVAACDFKTVAKNLWFARGEIPANQSVYGYPSFIGFYNLETLFHK
jgi:hypothetical protein